MLDESSSIEDGTKKRADIIKHGTEEINRPKKAPAPAEEEDSRSIPSKNQTPDNKAIKAKNNPAI